MNEWVEDGWIDMWGEEMTKYTETSFLHLE